MGSGAPRVSLTGLERPGSPGLGTSDLEDGVVVEVAVVEGVLGSDEDVGDGEYFVRSGGLIRVRFSGLDSAVSALG